MRILTFTSLFPNHCRELLGSFIYQRMRHVKLAGCEVDVIAPIPCSSLALPVAKWQAMAKVSPREQIGELAVYHPRYLLVPKISLRIHGYSMYASSLELARELHGRRTYDCIDAHYVYPDGFAAILLGKKLNLPVIVSARGSDITLYPSYKLVGAMIQKTLRDAAGLVAVSSSLARRMIQMGANRNKLKVIGNGVDLQRFSPLPVKLARQKLNIPENARVLVCVGNLTKAKGHELLIRSVASVARAFPQLRLYCIGDGPMRTRISHLIRELGLELCVTLTGAVPNDHLKFWYSAADISCLASEREGWPNVLLESMACGTPVVATAVGGIPEVIASDDYGLVIDRNTDAFSGALERALTKSWKRDAIVSYARSRSWHVVAEEVIGFLQSIVQRAPDEC